MMLIGLFVGFVLFSLFLFHRTDDGIQGLTLARQALKANIELYPNSCISYILSESVISITEVTE